MSVRNILVSVLVLALAGAAYGQRKKLKPGDAAPGLDIEEWVEGAELKIEKDKVYVILFWEAVSARSHVAGSTLKVFSHLRELYETHAPDGLMVLAVGSGDVEDVRVLMKGHGKGVGFGVAADRRNSTKRSWYDAAKLEKMPAVFIVDRKGRIAFIGDPTNDQFDVILDRVLRGRFDARLEDEAVGRLKAARRARKVRNWRMALRHYDEVIALDPNVFAEIAIERCEMMVVDMDDRQQTYDYVRTVLLEDYFKEDPGALRMLAEKIGSDPKIPTEARDMDLALELAEAARSVAGRHDPKALATLALVHYRRGELDEAIEYQKQAYFVALPNCKPDYRRDLKVYQGAAKRAEMSGPS